MRRIPKFTTIKNKLLSKDNKLSMDEHHRLKEQEEKENSVHFCLLYNSSKSWPRKNDSQILKYPGASVHSFGALSHKHKNFFQQKKHPRPVV